MLRSGRLVTAARSHVRRARLPRRETIERSARQTSLDRISARACQGDQHATNGANVMDAAFRRRGSSRLASLRSDNERADPIADARSLRPDDEYSGSKARCGSRRLAAGRRRQAGLSAAARRSGGVGQEAHCRPSARRAGEGGYRPRPLGRGVHVDPDRRTERCFGSRKTDRAPASAGEAVASRTTGWIGIEAQMHDPNPQVDPNSPQPTPANPNPRPARTPTPPETPQREVPPGIPSPLPEQAPSPGPEPIGVPPTSPPEARRGRLWRNLSRR